MNAVSTWENGPGEEGGGFGMVERVTVYRRLRCKYSSVKLT